MSRAVGSTNQWREANAKKIAARAGSVYFIEESDGTLSVTTDPDEATHSWALNAEGERTIVAYRSTSRMMLLNDLDLIATTVPDE